MKNTIFALVIVLILLLPNPIRALILARTFFNVSEAGFSAYIPKTFSRVCILLVFCFLLFGFQAVEAQKPFNITEGKFSYRPVVKNNRVLWFESLELNKTIGRVSLYIHEDGNNKLITNDASVLFSGWPDLDDGGKVAFMKNMGRSHEVFLYDSGIFQETQITNNPAIKGSNIDMGLGNDKLYTGYVRIHGGDIVFKNRLGQIYLYQSKTNSIRAITNAPAQAANLGEQDADKAATGVAVPGGAHVKYFEFDGKHIVWMHEDRGVENNSKVSIYMAKAADRFVPKLITSFDAWVPNDKAVVIGKMWNPFFSACNGKIIWQYYLPSQQPKLPPGVKMPKMLKDYGADMNDVRIGFFDGTAVREISSRTAVTFQSVRIVNGQAIWSQIRKEGEGKNSVEYQEVISLGSGGKRTVVSYGEPPTNAKIGEVFWNGILDVEIVGENVFWVMGQTQCFEHFKMPGTNELFCLYKPGKKVGFFRESSDSFGPFLQMDRERFAGSGELDRGLYAFFSPRDLATRDISAVPVVGGTQISSDSFLTISDRKIPDQKKWRVDEPQRKQITDAFSIDFDFIPGCSEAVGPNETTIESVTLDVSAEKSPTARLEDIRSVALYTDENQDGRLDAADKLVGKRNGPLPAEVIFTFSGEGIKIERRKPKYFLVEMEIVEDVCPCGKYTVEISGEKLGVKRQTGVSDVSAGGSTIGSVIMPEAEKKEVRGDEQAGLPGQKLTENLVIVYKNFPVRCGRVKFKITTQPFEKGAVIHSSQGETTDEVILDLTQTGKDAMAEIGFQLGEKDGLYTVRASIVTEDGVVCDNKDYIFREHAGKMVLQLIDMNNPEYFTAVPDNANPDFDTWKATMSSDIEKLSLDGEGREGTLADGASMLLVRIKLVGFKDPPAGNINVSISGDQNIGHLSRGLGEEIPGYDGGNSLSVQWMKTRTGVYGFALYTPPKNFGYTNAGQRNVNLKAVYALQGAPEPLVNEQALMLLKPPIAFIHGLWSGNETWGEEPYTLQTSQYEVHFIDYSSLSSFSFAELGGELELGIRDIVRDLRRRKIAATRVNVVGHSMGGLVARQFFADDHGGKFFRKDNFGKGDVYKLITLGTPHYGSPLAWLLIKLREQRFSPVQDLARTWKIDIESGAIDALCPGSRDLLALGVTHIPTNTARAWIYDSRTDALSSGDSLEKLLFEMHRVLRDPKSVKKATPAGFMLESLKFAANVTGRVLLSRLYSADRTDILVTLESQGGGIAQGANNIFPATLHFDTGYDLSPFLYSETTSEPVAAHIFDTLNRDYDAIDYFAPKIPAPIVPDPGIACNQ